MPTSVLRVRPLHTGRPALLGAALLALASFATAATSISVDVATKLRTVDERVFGLNTTIWDPYVNTAETISLLNAAGVRMLRFPGGSLSDEYHWQTNTSLNNTWQWATDTDDFLNLAKQTGAQAVITANYGTGTPAEAAAWVTYCNVTKSAGFKYWEIGNENYGSWEADSQSRPHDPFTYANRAKDYIALMKAADPTIKVGVVVTLAREEYATYTDHPVTNSRTGATQNGWNAVLLSTLRTLGVTPDFVALHRYDGAPGQESDSALLQKARTWPEDIAALRQQLTDYLGATGSGVEILVTENNSVYSNPGKQTTSLVNALYLADSVGNLLQTEVNALTWWDLRNGQDNGNNNAASLYGWRAYGDYGIVSSPSSFGSSTAYDCYPTYYAFKLLAKFARGGDRLVQVTTGDTLLSAFGCLGADGKLRLLVVNKSPSATTSATISVSGFTPAANATTYTYGMVEDNAARTGSGAKDIATGSIANAAASFSTNFEPYSITVLTFTAGTSSGGGSSGGGSSGGGSSGGGGGGAVALWFALALAGLGRLRLRGHRG
ncbi:MAG: hypothetical protein QM691_15725 [Opitutaceae bacterium]